MELFRDSRYFTKTLLAKQCIRILKCSSSPSRNCKIVAKELQHNSLFLVPGSLPPQSLNQFRLAQREIEEGASCRVTVISSHIVVSCNNLELRFLECKGLTFATLDWVRTNQTLGGIKPKGNTQSFRIRPCHLSVTSCSRCIQQQLLAFAVECPNHVSEPKPFSPCRLIWGSPICCCTICCRCPSIDDVKGSH